MIQDSELIQNNTPPDSGSDITWDDFEETVEDYNKAFPEHPGFNYIFMCEGTPAFYKAYEQMQACILGERDEPVTDKSIGLTYPEGADI